MITNLDQLEAYLFKEGLTRFCVLPYKKISEEDIFCPERHLTNVAINKRNNIYKSEFCMLPINKNLICN